MLWVILVLAACALAAWAYLVRERLGAGGVGLTALRATAFLGIVALLANASLRGGAGAAPTTVLLDASLSMGAGRLPWPAVLDSAVDLAGRGGLVLRFGAGTTPFDSTPPVAGHSRVRDALAVAAARGGRIVILTDGELDDDATIPAALRERAAFVVLPRAPTPGLAVTDVALPPRVLVGDSIVLTVEIATWGALSDSTAVLEVRAADRVLFRRTVPVPPGTGRGRRTVSLPPGVLTPGTHVVTVSVTAASDDEHRDDVRQRVTEVSALPTAVLVADPLDWEARFLARELADVVPGGLRAFGYLGAGRWIDLQTQAAVPAARVAELARAAAIAITRGNGVAGARPRRIWRWLGGLGGGLEGDWYVGGDLGASDLVPRLAGISWDSLPPVSGVIPVNLPGYDPVLLARLGRHGAQRVVLAARDSAGRRDLVSTAEGFWRWAFRGGADREAYRALLSAGVEWLLRGVHARAQEEIAVETTVQRGVAVPVRWTGVDLPADTVALEFTDADTAVMRRVAFGEDRVTTVALPPGVYRWRATGAARGQGITVVEGFSSEFVPRTPVPSVTAAGAAAGAGRIGLRELWWVFGLAMLALFAAWAWRVRRGLP